MKRKLRWAGLLLLLLTSLGAALGIHTYQRKYVIALADAALVDRLTSQAYEEYELNELLKKDGRWFVNYVTRAGGVLGNDITIIVEDNEARVLDSE